MRQDKVVVTVTDGNMLLYKRLTANSHWPINDSNNNLFDWLKAYFFSKFLNGNINVNF